jgi:hypothetical protein
MFITAMARRNSAETLVLMIPPTFLTLSKLPRRVAAPATTGHKDYGRRMAYGEEEADRHWPLVLLH